jgi:hypothetical protein
MHNFRKNLGASGFAPGENTQILGWDSGLAPNDSPGQLKKDQSQDCIGASDPSPFSAEVLNEVMSMNFGLIVTKPFCIPSFRYSVPRSSYVP